VACDAGSLDLTAVLGLQAGRGGLHSFALSRPGEAASPYSGLPAPPLFDPPSRRPAERRGPLFYRSKYRLDAARQRNVHASPATGILVFGWWESSQDSRIDKFRRPLLMDLVALVDVAISAKDLKIGRSI
jgi:hypothetical protein